MRTKRCKQATPHGTRPSEGKGSLCLANRARRHFIPKKKAHWSITTGFKFRRRRSPQPALSGLGDAEVGRECVLPRVHFVAMPVSCYPARSKSPPEHDSDGLSLRRRETQPTPQLGETLLLIKPQCRQRVFGCHSLIWSQGNWPHHLSGRLVLALTLIRDCPQKAAFRPGQVGHFHDYLRPHPMHLREL